MPTAVGGSALVAAAATTHGDWSPTGTLFSGAVSSTTDAIAAFEQQGYKVNFKGVLWSQGEQDAGKIYDGTITLADYKTALASLLTRFQTEFENTSLFIFQTGTRTSESDSGYYQVREAQRQVADENEDAFLVFWGAVDFALRGMLINDGSFVHYNQAGLNEMGMIGANNVVSAISKTGWQTKTSNLFYMTGQIYIGTSTTATSTNGLLTVSTTTGTMISLGRVAGTASIKALSTAASGAVVIDGDTTGSNGGLVGLNFYSTGNVILANGGGNVGIGTSSPSSLFSISNSASTAVNTPLFTIASTTAGTATSSLLTVLANGSTIIGTSTAYGKFTVSQDSIAGGYASYVTGQNNNFISVIENTQNSSYAGGLYINVHTNASAANSPGLLSVEEGGTSRFLVDADGNVGIGKTSPATALDVVGTASSTGLQVNGDSTLTGTLTVGGNATINGVINATASLGGSAIGYGASVTGDYYGLALGRTAQSITRGGIAIGYLAKATGTTAYSTAIGTYAYASGTDSLALGGYGIAGGNRSISMGRIDVEGDYSLGIALDNTTYTLNKANVMAIMGGNVGIGTTTPNNLLDIYSTTKSAIGFSGASGSTYKWTMGMDVTNAGRFSIASSTALGTTDRFVIDGNGYVGIGNTRPRSTLHVGNDTLTRGILTIEGQSGNAVDYESSSIEFYTLDGSGNGPQVASKISKLTVNADGSGGQLAFYTAPGAGGSEGDDPTERMRITGAGNVGIGTSTPFANLSITGTAGQTTPLFAISTSTSGYATNTAFIINSSGRIGVNTGSPVDDFHIQGSSDAIIFATDQENFLSTLSGNAGGFRTDANNTVNIDLPSGSNFNYNTRNLDGSSRDLIFTTGAGTVTVMTLQGGNDQANEGDVYFSNDVGIGTSTPTSLLQVAGATAPKITLSDTDATTNQKHWFIESNTGAFSIGTTSDALATNATYRALTIDSTGKVGIGSTTPVSLFSVQGPLSSSGIVSTISAGNPGFVALIENVQGSTYASGLRINVNGTASAANSSGLLSVQEGGTSRFLVDGDGNVGIGDSSPASLLTVGNGDLFNVTSSGNVGIGTTTPNNLLDIYSTTKSAIGFSGASGSTYKWTMGMDVTNAGRFSIASSTALGTTDRLVILGNGYVGIGTTTPAKTLDVYGDAVFGTGVAGDSVIDFSIQSVTKWVMGADDSTTNDDFVISTSSLGTRNLFVISGNSGNVAIGTTTASTTSKFAVYISSTVQGGVLTTTGGWIQGSDARWKKDVTDLESPLDKVMRLRPVRYNWKDEEATTTGRHIGFIAQEVEGVAPELVGDMNGFKALSYAEFAPLFAGAIQEQQTQIEDIQAIFGFSSTTAEGWLVASSDDLTDIADQSSLTLALEVLTEEFSAGLKISKEFFTAKIVAMVGLFDRVTTKWLEVDKGMTVKDKATGSYYCIYVENGIQKTEPGKCDEVMASGYVAPASLPPAGSTGTGSSGGTGGENGSPSGSSGSDNGAGVSSEASGDDSDTGSTTTDNTTDSTSDTGDTVPPASGSGSGTTESDADNVISPVNSSSGSESGASATESQSGSDSTTPPAPDSTAPADTSSPATEAVSTNP